LFYHGEFYTSIENKPGQPIKVPLMDVGKYSFVLFYTQSDNSNLSQPFGGMSGKEILEMVMKMPNVGGISLISNINEAWFGFRKQDFPEKLAR